MNPKQILFAEQRGRCATCEDERKIARLVVDHSPSLRHEMPEFIAAAYAVPAER